MKEKCEVSMVINGILLGLIVIFMSVQQVAKKAFSNRCSGGALTFSAASCVAALTVFLVTAGGELHFTWAFVGYSVAFAASYCFALIFGLLAIKVGPLSLSSLLSSFSLLIPTFYGIVALQEQTSLFLYLGLVLLLGALVLINFEKKGQQKKITLRWVIYVLLGFVGNGMCSTVQKIQQIHMSGQYRSEFMIVALGLCIVAVSILAVITERNQILPAVKKGAVCFVPCGLANGIVNFLVIYLSAPGRMAASVMFPVISGGGIVLTFLISVFVYKEKLSKWQLIGSGLGLISVILLNL